MCEKDSSRNADSCDGVCRQHSLLLTGIVVPVACVCVAFAVVATVFLRRQWTRAETRRLQLTVKLSGLATDEEVTDRALDIRSPVADTVRPFRKRLSSRDRRHYDRAFYKNF